MKIVSINPSVRGMKLTVPVDGTIDIDANGHAEVSDKAAEILVTCTNDWKYEDEAPSGNENTEPHEKSEDEEIVAGIKNMSLEEMINTAKEAEYPEEEWKRFAKKDKLMAAYLIKKYNEAKLEEENSDAE